MRIAMIGPFGFHPNKTMRSRALRLAQALHARGHAAALFMPPWQTPAAANRRWEEEGVLVRNVPLRGGTPGITRRLVREALAWEPDVVHCFKPKAYSGLVAWWLWQFQRWRVRLVMDSDDWEGWGGWNDRGAYTAVQKQFFAWQERYGMTHNHALTVASRELETRALAMGLPRARVVYVPNGPGIAVDAPVAAARRAQKRSELGIGAGPVVLLYSRLFEYDTQRLVAVLAAVNAAVANLTILSVGAGLFAEEAAQLRAQLDTAGLLDAVVDVGWVDEAELPLLLSLADVGLYLMDDTLLNRAKCPVKLADMAGMGVPVVGEAVGQVPEYVLPGETGLLRPSGDVVGLAADVVALLTDPDRRARLGSHGREHIQRHFTWPVLADALSAAYARTATAPDQAP